MPPNTITRRRLLRGMMQGATVGVGLPLLDVFLNDNGTALADGSPLPVCFGTWFWGLGLSPGQWEPKQTGADFQFGPQLRMLEPIKDKINLFSNMQVFLDGKPNTAHVSSIQGIMTGRVAGEKEAYGRSVDQLVADKLAVRTRFPSLTVSCDGDSSISYSSRGENLKNPAEISPLALYQRIFGSGFQDPNAAEFVPDAGVMLRKSALSAVKNDRQRLMKVAGSDDRVRLDEFFTSLRDLEQKLALELEKPAPLAACDVPQKPENEHPSIEINDVLRGHQLFSQLITHALACGQTRIFNITLTQNVVRAGDPTSYHQYTHMEDNDPVLGYQKECYWFAERYMNEFLHMVKLLDSVREGDGTLLDRTLVMGFTEHGFAKYHSLQGMPMLTAGRAGGGIKTGYHIDAGGDACSRVGFTCLRALGIGLKSWGSDSNQASEPFAEVLG